MENRIRYLLNMNSKDFKKAFKEIAQSYGFDSAFGGCYKKKAECMLVLELQKSNFGDYYELNIKIFVEGVFGNTCTPTKNLIKNDMGDVYCRPPLEYHSFFEFDINMSDRNRIMGLKTLFDKFLVPYEKKALSVSGIRMLAEEGIIFLLPAVKNELDRLYPMNY